MSFLALVLQLKYNPTMEQIRYRPIGAWKMDAAQLDDYSGYGNDIVASGVNLSIGLSSNTLYSTLFDDSSSATASVDFLTNGYDGEGFSLEAVVRVVDEGLFSIISHAGVPDGLGIDGKTVYFSTEMSDDEFVTASYTMTEQQSIHVVGVRSGRSNFLYVNGELVSTATNEEGNSSIPKAQPSGISFGEVTSGSVMISDCFVYNRPLMGEDVSYLYSKTFVDRSGRSHSGDIFFFGRSQRIPEIFREFSTQSDWESAVLDGAAVRGNDLVARSGGGGRMSTSIPLIVYGEDVVPESIVIEWEGDGVEVYYDFGGGPELATNHSSLDIPAPPFSEVTITTKFDTGQPDAFIRNLRVSVFVESVYGHHDGRDISYSGEVETLGDKSLGVLPDNTGVRLLGGSITLGEPLSVTDEFQTIELLVKNLTPTPPTVTTSAAVEDTFINGASYTPTPNEWHLMHIVLDAPETSLSISGNVEIAYVFLYDDALSPTESLRAYTNVVSSEVVFVSAGNDIGIAESATPVKIYAHDWEISAGG